jgi:hypothetical protein
MEHPHPITLAEEKFDAIAYRYEYLQKILNECKESFVLKQCIEEQLATDKKYYETALEELINIVMKNFWNDREFAERYVMIARKLRLEDPQGFKERVDAASEGFASFLDKNNVNN